jgi:hypothetical protein
LPITSAGRFSPLGPVGIPIPHSIYENEPVGLGRVLLQILLRSRGKAFDQLFLIAPILRV